MSTVHLAGLTLSAYSVRVSAIQSFNSSYGTYFIRARGLEIQSKTNVFNKNSSLSLQPSKPVSYVRNTLDSAVFT